MVIIVHFSLYVGVLNVTLELLAGSYLGMLLDGEEGPDGDHGALLSGDVQEVRAPCWDIPRDAP
jgi:hypothetical protein